MSAARAESRKTVGVSLCNVDVIATPPEPSTSPQVPSPQSLRGLLPQRLLGLLGGAGSTADLSPGQAQVAPRGDQSGGPPGSGVVGRAAGSGRSWPRGAVTAHCRWPLAGLLTQMSETPAANPPGPRGAAPPAQARGHQLLFPRGAQCGGGARRCPGDSGLEATVTGTTQKHRGTRCPPGLGDPPPSDRRADLCSPRMRVGTRAFALGWRPRAPRGPVV